MEIPALMLSSAEKLLEQAFRLDPEMLPALAGLSDKVMAVQLEGMAIRVYLLPHSQGISLLNHYEGETDVTVSAAPFTLLRMLATRDSSLLSSGEVVMEGDTKVAQRLMDVLAGLDIDWEEQLSKLTGDIPATMARSDMHESHAVFSIRWSAWLCFLQPMERSRCMGYTTGICC